MLHGCFPAPNDGIGLCMNVEKYVYVCVICHGIDVCMQRVVTNGNAK